MLFLQWASSNSLCNQRIRACTSGAPNFQQNWLFSQFLCLRDAKELVFNITFRFTECASNPTCNDDFFTLYHHCVPNPNSHTSLNPDNYALLNNTLEDSRVKHIPGRRSIREVRYLPRPGPVGTTGFYLGIEDTGTCGFISRLIVYYTVCPERRNGLVIYPEFAHPPKAGPDEVFEAKCVCNAHPVTNMNVTAFAGNGTCEDQDEGGAKCECDDGYFQDGDKCEGKLITVLW
jgi:hypothetical protein